MTNREKFLNLVSKEETTTVERAKAKFSGDLVLASDAFFPFRDVVDFCAKNEIKAIIQPGGSMRDEESIEAANEHGIPMMFTGIRHFLH